MFCLPGQTDPIMLKYEGTTDGKIDYIHYPEQETYYLILEED